MLTILGIIVALTVFGMWMEAIANWKRPAPRPAPVPGEGAAQLARANKCLAAAIGFAIVMAGFCLVSSAHAQQTFFNIDTGRIITVYPQVQQQQSAPLPGLHTEMPVRSQFQASPLQYPAPAAGVYVPAQRNPAESSIPLPAPSIPETNPDLNALWHRAHQQ